MPGAIWKWVLFNAFVLGILTLDLCVFHRRPREMRVKEALGWCGMWIALALAWNAGIYFSLGPHKALEFLTGYLVEESLSVDNLFVFLLMFSYFRVPKQYQHGVLFWGIIGAVAMRALFIATGVTLIHRFEWIIYVFGAVLIYSGIRMALKKEKKIRPEKNPVLKLFHRLMPVTENHGDGRFFVKRDGRRYATPLLVVLLMVETTDLIFAVDSIPAVLAITRDPFIVYTSNIFAVLGLRALYFALAGAMNLFHCLHYGLSLILVFVGTKMILSAWDVDIPTAIALAVVVGILTLSVIASLLWPKAS
ncbi:MAG TPA: TerC family protein [Verrucomicrobiae bacterium]|nr:TerC family protein [Verrucomicrobiae bacterium]